MDQEQVVSTAKPLWSDGRNSPSSLDLEDVNDSDKEYIINDNPTSA